MSSTDLALRLASPAGADPEGQLSCDESHYYCDEWNNLLYYVQIVKTGYVCQEYWIGLGGCE